MPAIPAALRYRIAAVVLGMAAALMLLIPALPAGGAADVAVRVIRPQAIGMPAAPPQAPPPTAPAGLAWDLPAGWTQEPTRPMRLASFATPAGACGLFVFAGGGDRLANVNRWRGQVGLEPVDAAALERDLAADRNGFGDFHHLAVRGADKAFLAALFPTPQGQCFVKLEVAPAGLDAAREGFLAFCRSLRPGAAP
jgi:hypothetical protein